MSKISFSLEQVSFCTHQTARLIILLTFLSIIVAHYLDDKRKTESKIKYETILNVLAPSNLLMIEYLLCLVFAFGFVFLLNLRLRRKETSNSFKLPFDFMFNLFSQHEPFFKRASSIGLVYVFALLFLFIMKNMLTSSTQTSKVSNKKFLELSLLSIPFSPVADVEWTESDLILIWLD